MKIIATALVLTACLSLSAAAQNTLSYRWLRHAKSSGVDRFNKVRVAPDGSVYAAGAFSNTADLSNGCNTSASVTSAGMLDGLLCKYDRLGALQWNVTIGTTGDDEVLGMAVDKYGYVYVAGYFSGSMSFPTSGGPINLTSAGGTDGFVAKYRPFGTCVYAYGFGSTGDDAANGIDVGGDGRVWLAGTFNGSFAMQGVFGTSVALTSRGGSDAFLAKFTDIGSMYWLVQSGGAGNDFASSATADVNGNGYMLGGFTGTATFASNLGGLPMSRTSVGGTDAVVVGVNRTSNLDWVTTMGGGYSETPTDIAADPRGTGVVAVGGFAGCARFGTTNLTSLGFNDAFITRLTNTGTFDWTKKTGGFGPDMAYGVRMDKAGNPIVGSSYSILTTLPNGAWAFSLGWMDGMMFKMSANGGSVMYYHQVVGYQGDDQVRGVDTADGGGVHMAGMYNGGTRFGMMGPYNCAGGTSDAFAACYTNNSGARIAAEEDMVQALPGQTGALKVAPNPSAEGQGFQIATDGMEGACTLQAFDLNGRPVMTQTISADGLTFGTRINTDLPAGLYLLHLQDEQGRTRNTRLVIK